MQCSNPTKVIPLKLKDPWSFIIHCANGELHMRRVLCDLMVSINLIPLSMMRNLKYEEPKSIIMTLTLVDWSRVYPYNILEDVLVKMD